MSNHETEKIALGFDGIRLIVREFFITLVHLVLLLWAAGTYEWINAYICVGLGVLNQAAYNAALLKYNPRLISKRGKTFQEGTKSFDRIFLTLYLLLSLAISAVSGLDAVRYQWSSIPAWLVYPGVIIYVLACAFGIWAMAVNQHFEVTVIIKSDGSQKVCDSGPYRFVRHPGYAAVMVGIPAIPLILQSLWGLALAGLVVIVFIVRTSLEDRALQNELPGYKEYAAKTRFRLIPFVW